MANRMIRETLYIRTLAARRIPLLFLAGPSVVALDGERAIIRIPLNWLTRNHLGSMYIGALVCGADLAAGLLAQQHIRRAARPVSLIFQDLHAEFLRRPDGDCDFTSDQGAVAAALVAQALEGGERVSAPLDVTARVPSRSGDDPVARFTLTVSLKAR